jgi:hypothetical protein
MQAEVKASAAGRSIASMVTSGSTSIIFYILVAGLGLSLLVRTVMLLRQKTAAALPFLHAASWQRELVILGLALLPATVPVIMYLYIYTKALFFSSVTVVKMLKLQRLVSEMTYLQSLGTKNTVSSTSCSGGNCFTADDRTSLIANLSDMIAQFQDELQVSQGTAKSQFEAVGPGSWALGILAVLISLIAAAGGYAASPLITIGAAAVLVVYAVTLGVTALDLKSPKFQNSQSYLASIVCNGNPSAGAKFIARLTGQNSNAFAAL